MGALDIINVLKRIESLEVKVSSKKKKNGKIVAPNADVSHKQNNALKK